MNLDEGISQYVLRRKAHGISFSNGVKAYRSFLKLVGNLPLREVNGSHVFQFLNRVQMSDVAFRKYHSLLRHLFDYWAAHGEMEWVLMPPNRPAQRSAFLPYIYAKEEIRELHRLARICGGPRDKLHHRTLSAILFTLYATGANVGEVVELTCQDVDLRLGLVRFSSSSLRVSRSIPICKALVRLLRQYANWRSCSGVQSLLFFSRLDGQKIGSRTLSSYFERIRAASGIVGHRQSSQRPCLRDFRATFAVHRINLWMKQKANLDVMLPALGAYLGNSGMESTERYLQLTPQRFQAALNKLSPNESRTSWQRDPALLEFLANL